MNKLIALGFVAAVALTSNAAMAAGDAAAGEKTAKTRCVACHTFEQGGANKVGPNLFGVTSRGPGTTDGYNYSTAFKEAVAKGFEWNDQNLGSYLEDPTAFLRSLSGDEKARSKMTFKLTKEDDRANVIAYLDSLK